jgi:hypothetical protein
MGKKANEPYSAELLATPICAMIQTLSHKANITAITAPDINAQRVSTLQNGINL